MDTNKIKKGLGRGLSSLIGETKPEININKVSISDLVSNKFQPRKTFNEESLFLLSNIVKSMPLIFNSGFRLTFIRSMVFISCVKPSKAKNSVCSGTNNEWEDTKAITVSKLSDGGQSIST